jgi:hypothetical protein
MKKGIRVEKGVVDSPERESVLIAAAPFIFDSGAAFESSNSLSLLRPCSARLFPGLNYCN